MSRLRPRTLLLWKILQNGAFKQKFLLWPMFVYNSVLISLATILLNNWKKLESIKYRAWVYIYAWWRHYELQTASNTIFHFLKHILFSRSHYNALIMEEHWTPEYQIITLKREQSTVVQYCSLIFLIGEHSTSVGLCHHYCRVLYVRYSTTYSSHSTAEQR